MKRTLALILAAILLAAALASCATAPKAAISARIRVTSSDGEDAAASAASEDVTRMFALIAPAVREEAAHPASAAATISAASNIQMVFFTISVHLSIGV